MKKIPALGSVGRTLAFLFTLFPAIAYAHPGHDDHELTWDLGHLAAHPIATLGCFLVIAAGVWVAGKLLRRRATAARKLRTANPPVA